MYKVKKKCLQSRFQKSVSTLKHTSFIAILISPTSIHHFLKVVSYLALHELNHQKLKFK